MKEPLLLHLCCGPCATHVIDFLKDSYYLIGFFFNPNIHPEREFYNRLEAVCNVCKISGTALWVPRYQPDLWMHAIQGRETDSEGGHRCRICFGIRMEAAAYVGRVISASAFATTLTISPHKNSGDINELGNRISEKYEIPFLSHDFKKRDGFQKSVRKSKELGLYRQKYCGCCFSS